MHGILSEKFREIENRIRNDKKDAGVMLEMRRSKFIPNILELLRENVIRLNDIEEFIDKLKQTVNIFMDGDRY